LLSRYGFRINFSFFMVRANQRHFCSPVAIRQKAKGPARGIRVAEPKALQPLV